VDDFDAARGCQFQSILNHGYNYKEFDHCNAHAYLNSSMRLCAVTWCVIVFGTTALTALLILAHRDFFMGEEHQDSH
jgi:hypothetical protein